MTTPLSPTWAALRQNELGEQYVESFTMYKVPVHTADEIMQKIKSTKWIAGEDDGQIPVLHPGYLGGPRYQ